MTQPRCIVPGSTYLITRRCNQQLFLLIPDDETREAYLYCLALAAKRYDVAIHAICIMSNHHHVAATDTKGQMPAFLQYFHRLLALCVKSIRGWEHVVWEPGRQTSLVQLLGESDVINKTLYAMSNPIKAGICKKESQWPGILIEGSHTAKRPKNFNEHRMPKSATLTLQPPKGISKKRWHQTLQEQMPQVRQEARSIAVQRRGQHGRLFVGAKRALSMSHLSRPSAAAEKGGLSPRFASVCKRTLVAAIKQWKAFCEAYQDARARFKQGHHTSFPAGTWKMVQLGCACES